jgi:pimeloyl-ACP methyl ester carboxylesterase
VWQDSFFKVGWKALTLFKGVQNRSPISTNEIVNARLFRLNSDPFVHATYLETEQKQASSSKISVVYFQGLGTSLSETIDWSEEILKSFEALGFFCTIYVLDQMQSMSIDLLIASAAEVIDLAASKGSPVFLFGYSLGTGVATYGLLRWYETYVDSNTVLPIYPQLILLSPFTSLSDVREQRTNWESSPMFGLLDYSFKSALGHNLDLSTAIRKMPFKVVMSGSRHDELINYEQFIELGNAKNSLGKLPLQIHVDGDHSEPRKLLRDPSYLRKLLDF